MLWLSNSTSLEVTCTRPGQVFRGLCSIRGRLLQLHLHTFSIRDNRRSSVFTSNFKSQVLLRSDSCPTPCQLTDALAIDFDKFDTQTSHSAQVGRTIAERLGALPGSLLSEVGSPHAARCANHGRLSRARRSLLGATVAEVCPIRLIASGVPFRQNFHGQTTSRTGFRPSSPGSHQFAHAGQLFEFLCSQAE
jgi:hypothetical protein